MDVSVIIVNYNTKDLTINCLNSIYEMTTGIDYEVIVVDNGSSDDSVKNIRKQFSQVQIIENQNNLGFGQANNIGAKIAQGDFLLFLNSDTLLLNNAILMFFDFFVKNQSKLSIGCLGTVLYDANMQPTHSFQRFPTFNTILTKTFNHYLGISPFHYEKKQLDGIREYLSVDYVTGADLFLPKELFVSFGGFNPGFFMYYEETYLQYQISMLGLKKYIIDTPQIIHLEGASYNRKISNKKRIDMDRSLFIYLNLRYPRWKVTLFHSIYFLLRLPIIAKSQFKLRENIKYLRELISFN